MGAGGSFWTQGGGRCDVSSSLEKPADLPWPLGGGALGGPPLPRSRDLTHEPSFPGTQGHGTRPGLGKRTTCLLDFIRFQEEATGFTLKITKLANSSDTQMVFESIGHTP